MKTERLISYIKDWLDAKEWEPIKLADLTGIKSPSIYDLLNGKTQNPKPETLRRIANAMGVAVEELYERAGISMTDTTPRGERIRQLMATWDDLSEADQDTLLFMARTMREKRKLNEAESRQTNRVRNKPGTTQGRRAGGSESSRLPHASRDE